MKNLSKPATDGCTIFFVLDMALEPSRSRESLSADVSCNADFQSELHSKMEAEHYTLSQVFYADETGLWWSLMPLK